VHTDDFKNHTEALKAVGVTNLQIVKDQRIIRIIKMDRRPEIAGNTVSFVKGKTKDKDTFSFGCGAVHLTRKEIETFLRVREIYEKIPVADRNTYDEILENAEGEGNVYPSEIDTADVKAILARYK
jgi:hypothetical protein